MKKKAAVLFEQPLPRSSLARLPFLQEDTGFAEETFSIQFIYCCCCLRISGFKNLKI
jgi:hypothetical protein